MLSVENGQCGLCAHFGEDHAADKNLVQVRTTHKADEHLVEECGHPKHKPLHLIVTPISSCTGYEPARMN